jgi:hypothetical protein
MHYADKNFTEKIKSNFHLNHLPRWWNNFSKAPKGIEGIDIGYNEACTMGISGFGKGICFLSSKSFFEIVLYIFSLSVQSDIPYLTTATSVI